MQEGHKHDFDPQRLAALYYFGDLSCWKLPQIAADALERGYDGTALRRLAGLINPVETDIQRVEIDCAFREMGVVTPIPKHKARLVLAAESARRAINGEWNVFDAATHIRIHLCKLEDPPEELRRIVDLSTKSRCAPRIDWARLEDELKNAMVEFVKSVNDREAPRSGKASSQADL